MNWVHTQPPAIYTMKFNASGDWNEKCLFVVTTAAAADDHDDNDDDKNEIGLRIAFSSVSKINIRVLKIILYFCYSPFNIIECLWY